MKIINAILILGFTTLFTSPFNPCMAQTKPIPASVASNFSDMFPKADKIEWMNKIDLYAVTFTDNNMKCEAKFQPDGRWLSTERQIPTDSIPKTIKDSLGTGPYANWSVLKAFLLTLPMNDPQYRICVSNAASLRKTLSFTQRGRLTRD